MATEWLMVRPAYGRRYLTNEAMRADWDSGKDFQISLGGPYISCRDVTKNTMDIRSEYVGIQIVQPVARFEMPDGRIFRWPFLTEEITW